MKYQVCASFQLNNCNAVHDFILKANPFLSGDSNKIISFYESILEILSTSDNSIMILFEPTKSYLETMVSYVERLKEIKDNQLLVDSSTDNLESFSSENLGEIFMDASTAY